MEIFSAVQQLIKLMGLTFQFDGTQKFKSLQREWPEAKIMSLVLIAAKLAWGMDGIERVCHDKAEPAVIGPDPKRWENFLAENKFKGDSLYDYTDMDILNMSGEELDAYMGWYERTWLGSGKTKCKVHILLVMHGSRN